jgi:acetoin utilization protein AcuB
MEENLLNHPVKVAMTSPVIVISPDTPLEEALRIMDVMCIRRVPVVEGDELVGIISLRDVQEALKDLEEHCENGETPGGMVADAMTTEVFTISPNAPIGRAAEIMLQEKIAALPVIEPGGKLIGIITESDIFEVVVRLWKGEDPSIDAPNEDDYGMVRAEELDAY